MDALKRVWTEFDIIQLTCGLCFSILARSQTQDGSGGWITTADHQLARADTLPERLGGQADVFGPLKAEPAAINKLTLDSTFQV